MWNDVPVQLSPRPHSHVRAGLALTLALLFDHSLAGQRAVFVSKTLLAVSGVNNIQTVNPASSKVVSSFPESKEFISDLVTGLSGPVLVSTTMRDTLQVWNPANG